MLNFLSFRHNQERIQYIDQEVKITILCQPENEWKNTNRT
jgi:hypothetical protein